MSEPKPILVITFPNITSHYDIDTALKGLSSSPIAKDYHILSLRNESNLTTVEILSIKEMDIEKQNQILDAVDKLMSKH